MATSFFSILLLGASGWLLDTHRRDWVNFDATNCGPEAQRFALCRYLRRMTATSAIALVGFLVAFWPILPQEPRWILPYTGILALLAILILILGCFDAVASSTYYSQQLREENRKHCRELVRQIETEQAKMNSSVTKQNSKQR